MNKHKLFLKGLLLLSIILTVYIYFTRNFTGLSVSILAFSLVTIPIFIILLFLHEKIFLGWSKFAIIWLLSSIFIISKAPEYGGSSFMPGPGRKFIGWLLASFFLLISIGLILWKSRKNREKN